MTSTNLILNLPTTKLVEFRRKVRSAEMCRRRWSVCFAPCVYRKAERGGAEWPGTQIRHRRLFTHADRIPSTASKHRPSPQGHETILGPHRA